jgi:hypothetical protein
MLTGKTTYAAFFQTCYHTQKIIPERTCTFKNSSLKFENMCVINIKMDAQEFFGKTSASNYNSPLILLYRSVFFLHSHICNVS